MLEKYALLSLSVVAIAQHIKRRSRATISVGAPAPFGFSFLSQLENALVENGTPYRRVLGLRDDLFRFDRLVGLAKPLGVLVVRHVVDPALVLKGHVEVTLLAGHREQEELQRYTAVDNTVNSNTDC
jgi:hypothetical protein